MAPVTRNVTRRARGGARNVSGVTHLGGDRWRVRLYAGLDPLTGKQRQLSRTFRAPNKTDANRQAEALRVGMRAELTETASRKGTVAELGDRFLALKARECAPTTVKNYTVIVGRIVDTFGRLPASALTGDMIDDWYDRLLAGGMSKPTLAHHHAVLRAMLRSAYRKGHLSRVATDQASAPKADKYKARPPSLESVRLLLNGATGDTATAFFVQATTGIRRGELVGLRWSDLEGGVLTVRRSITELPGRVLHEGPPKGKHERAVPLAATTWLVLMRHRQRLVDRCERRGGTLATDGPVFPSPRDRDGARWCRPSWISHRWDELRTRLGLDAVRLHDLRHFHATLLTDAGIPVTAGAKRLGHALTSTFTDVYGHGTDEADARAVTVITLALPAPRA
jgi:integrase